MPSSGLGPHIERLTRRADLTMLFFPNSAGTLEVPRQLIWTNPASWGAAH